MGELAIYALAFIFTGLLFVAGGWLICDLVKTQYDSKNWKIR